MTDVHTTDIALEVRELSRTFGVRKALNKVSFDLPDGAFLSVFGPNGAGKTTLIKVLTTVTVPSKGTARVCGLDVVEDAVELREKIGLISHNPLLYPDLSAEENLQFFAEMYGVSDVSDRVRELLVSV
jgi:heme exporter protein A